MKIWVDDIRTPPKGHDWFWIKNSADTISYLQYASKYALDQLVFMSLDHDLGGDDTTRPIVIWMCENDFWPVQVVVHSANPPGVYWLEGMIDRYHPNNAHKHRLY